MMKIQRCKGTRDLSPAEMKAFRLIEGTFRESCLKWGYEEVKTPTLEYLHLFTSTGTLTPGMLGKVYSFLDWDGWSGERVVLRPDGTIPVARFFIEHMADKALAKLFYTTNVFIFEETGKETREKWQCGAELIGAGSTTADVELIVLVLEVLQKLGLKDIQVRLSHAGVIRALLTGLGLNPEEQARVFDQILDGDAGALARIRPGKSEAGKALSLLLDLKGKSSGFLRNLGTLVNLPGLEPPLKNFIEIIDLLESSGYDCQIDIASGRGFEYYTGVIFQLFPNGTKIGGGGRYDALIPLLGGKNVPASGFALYLDHLMDLVKPGSIKSAEPRVLIRTEPASRQEGLSLASSLHSAGYVAEVDLGQSPADFRWTVDVRTQAPRFVLTDRGNHQELQAQTAKDVLAILNKG
ncbi:MAG: HisS family protein [Chloroflexota bacterium]|nr:HisS family protein [Chloroflexota bacterium]